MKEQQTKIKHFARQVDLPNQQTACSAAGFKLRLWADLFCKLGTVITQSEGSHPTQTVNYSIRKVCIAAVACNSSGTTAACKYIYD
jgi:hypothetical protein